MHPTDANDEAELQSGSSHRIRRRLALVLCVVLVVVLLVFFPPLISFSRYQRRIATDISASIGRPVHFDNISLTMLPVPGFTLTNFVIEDDPAFSHEPMLRSDEVRVALRIGSLWRRRVEFSTISFGDGTSINLVHRSDGRWNIEGLLFQASHIEAAPTAQRYASEAPRFPYIEATGARLNLKLDAEKTPFALTDGDLALWEPESHEWRFRIEAHPVRTDTSPGETGTFRIEGTLGKQNLEPHSLAATPVELHGDWRDAQLGGLTQFAFGREAGVRGDVSGAFTVAGTLERNVITTHVSVANARRADFIPPQPLSLEAACRADAADTFHSFTGIECRWPPAEASNHSTLVLTAEVPSVQQPDSAKVHLTFPAVPASTLFDWLAVATPHPPKKLSGGILSGALDWGASASGGNSWTGELEYAGGSVQLDPEHIVPLGEVMLRSTPVQHPAVRNRRPTTSQPPPLPDSFDLLPVEIALGGGQPVVVQGQVNDAGYTLHLAGTATPEMLLALGSSIPQLGDGMKSAIESLPGADRQPTQKIPVSTDTHPSARGVAGDTPIAVDLTATRSWGSAQQWQAAAPPSPAKSSRARR